MCVKKKKLLACDIKFFFPLKSELLRIKLQKNLKERKVTVIVSAVQVPIFQLKQKCFFKESLI